MKQSFFLAMMLVIFVVGGLVSIDAQDLPADAVLPAGRDAWAVDQNFKTNIYSRGFQLGYIRVIVLSNGLVFHRKSFDTGQPATPWCQNKFSAADSRKIRDAMAKARPASWDAAYGPWVNALAPFRVLIVTTRGPKDQIIERQTNFYRFKDLPADASNLLNAIDDAGELAFSRCQTPVVNDPVVEKGMPVYAVNGTGDLLWYNHSGYQNGDATWANKGAAKNVGHDWTGNAIIFKGEPRGTDGIVYTVGKQGWLSWYKHDGHASGSPDWQEPKNVGTGFTGRQVFSGGGGVIYMIDKAGDLYWYKHLGNQTGERTWMNNAVGRKVGSGWNDVQFVFSGGGGVIYSLDGHGDLYWQKHLGIQNGTETWSPRKKVAGGWLNFRQVFSGGDGVIYAVTKDGKLCWYKHLGFSNGMTSWANDGAPKVIGGAWNFNFVF